MRPLALLPIAAVAASLVLAGCGGSSSSPGQTASSDTVSVKNVDGIGAVLFDAAGKALYSPEQDTATRVQCTGACMSIWQPLTPGAGKPIAPSGAPALSVIQRPDGTRQLTAGGRPLYTFAEDSAGDVTGDGAIDKFGGRSFTWHAVVAGKRTAPATTSSNQTRSGYGY